MTTQLSATTLPAIETELERSAVRILAEYAVDSCEKFIGKEPVDRLHVGYAIRRGNDFILIRKLYAASERGSVEALDERWTLEIDNKIVGGEYRTVEDALDAASIGGRSR
ncbi:MAG TPA: DUF5634 family protein [Paenibacillus sp.]|nr:DUF5634 family protein [Paenibacillus sp.]